jgi:hypothetical protein
MNQALGMARLSYSLVWGPETPPSLDCVLYPMVRPELELAVGVREALSCLESAHMSEIVAGRASDLTDLSIPNLSHFVL